MISVSVIQIADRRHEALCDDLLFSGQLLFPSGIRDRSPWRLWSDPLCAVQCMLVVSYHRKPSSECWQLYHFISLRSLFNWPCVADENDTRMSSASSVVACNFVWGFCLRPQMLFFTNGRVRLFPLLLFFFRLHPSACNLITVVTNGSPGQLGPVPVNYLFIYFSVKTGLSE